MEHDRALTFSQVFDITSLSRTTLWRMEKAGTFPHRFLLSPGRVGWSEIKVMAWVATREEKMEKHPAPKRTTTEPEHIAA